MESLRYDAPDTVTGPDGLTRDAVREAGCVDEGSIFADAPTPIRIEA
jgi:hypothetical protein